MRIKMVAALATTLLLVALVSNVSAAPADEHSGTWKMNPCQVELQPWASTEEYYCKDCL